MAGEDDYRLAPKRFTLPPVGARVAQLTRDIFRHRGFTQSHILARWPEIVGADLAEFCAPEQMNFPRRAGEGRGPQTGATLIIRVDGPIALEIRHLEPQIIERINGFYGYQAVARLKLIQGPLPARPNRRRPAPRQLAPRERAELAEALQPIAEPGLKTALERLGTRILGRTQRNDREGRF
jgi:hypothetical protein